MTPDTATATALRKRNRAFTRAFRGRNPSISIGVAITLALIRSPLASPAGKSVASTWRPGFGTKRGESWQRSLGLGARSRRLWIPENRS